MSDENVTHEDVVKAIRKALVDTASDRNMDGYVRFPDAVLKLAQSYEIVHRTDFEYIV